MSLTSSSRSSSATASGLPDAALGTVSPGRNEDLPVPAQEMCVHAQGLKTTQGGQGPRDDGPVPVAFCMPRRHRHPRLNFFRPSIPRLYAPLSTLRVLPRGSVPRMTRGQCGSLLLHCNGLSPSTSCRSSRRTAAQWLAYTLPYRRFADALADACAQIGGDVDCCSLIAVDFHHILLASLPAHSLTLRPAGLLNRLKRPLSRGSSPAGYPAEPLVSYQINRQLSGWNLPPLVIRAFGAHCHG